MNMKKTIVALLYQYDCVIVPGLGGFIAKNTESEFNPIDYTFSPPRKKIGFNSDLVHTDGLLANAIAKENGMDYKNAVLAIDKEVALWKEALNQGKSIQIEGLGVLNKQNQSLNFQPEQNINFALETFGLEPVKATYILREKSEPKSVAKTTSAWGSYAAAIALAIGVGVTSFFANHTLVQPQLSSILPFTLNAEIPQRQNVADFILEQSEHPIEVSSTSNKNMEANEVVVAEPVPVVEQVEVVKEPEVAEVVVKPYQVIGGSYKRHSEAIEEVANMKKKGYNNAVIVGKVGSYFMVAYDTFDSEDEALALKRSLEAKKVDVFLRK
ncbi:hypothetical protein Q787_09525 [Ornithobacterium rhinotracheale H06-030791]|uniref:Sporulation related protein n=3 Tax=Ornithobacterium rhinotracheale TaxID=28251 RepID=I4A2C9_ORNRL|nr:sporulation related protein [Ornithobacterium rhinotracheale DSM 15997]AIP99878.1 hypothetical protein Q785_09710 [Ornithobacterium rhinotracheale ORT-UMN 88]KGB66315.1 hypothetical protein Q787_09525 [Ornithobacterium rhinotracheale H06-030791]MBN3661747.1 SPOR domain-containing protein [Ornithobacterium rhinotracheale]